jgi:hypothetical protein
MTEFQNRLLFVVVTALVILGMHFVLVNWISTGPNLDMSMGWLGLHRYVGAWTIESFYPVRLIVMVSVSVLVTGILSKMSRRGMA